MNFHIHPENLPTDEHGHPKTSLSTDWFNGRFQWLIFDTCDEPAVYVRISKEGEIAEIAIRNDLAGKVKSDLSHSPWQDERDKDEKDEINEQLKISFLKEIADMRHEREKHIASEDALADRNELIVKARKLLGLPLPAEDDYEPPVICEEHPLVSEPGCEACDTELRQQAERNKHDQKSN